MVFFTVPGTGTSEAGFYGVLYRNVGSIWSTGSQVGGIRSGSERGKPQVPFLLECSGGSGQGFENSKFALAQFFFFFLMQLCNFKI